MAKELKMVVFAFKDGSILTLEGDALDTWESICSFHSDYLLPGDSNMVLASRCGGLIQGFVPPEICKE